MREKARGLTDRIHGVRGELEDAVKHQVAALEEDIPPVPAVVFDNVMRFCLDPKVEGNESNAAYPSRGRNWSIYA